MATKKELTKDERVRREVSRLRKIFADTLVGKSTHAIARELNEQGIYSNTIRLSIGTENIDDIIEDLEGGFQSV